MIDVVLKHQNISIKKYPFLHLIHGYEIRVFRRESLIMTCFSLDMFKPSRQGPVRRHNRLRGSNS